MDTSSFICALRHFLAIRGLVAKIRCDQRTNFVAGKEQLEDTFLEIDKIQIQKFTAEQGCEWMFNSPQSSHFGGVWERQIGTVRRVLDTMLLKIGRSQLTRCKFSLRRYFGDICSWRYCKYLLCYLP